MAITKGHGNPHWTEDEVVLALDLYFKLAGNAPGPSDPQVIDLSHTLRSIPYHAEAARKESFRNADGVAFKLQNLRQLATGKGLANTSKTDKTVWERFGHDPAATSARAALIRQATQILSVPEIEPDEEVFAEGKAVTRAHRRVERSKELRKKLLEQRRLRNEVRCDICGYHNRTGDRRFEYAGLEAHHLRPLAILGATATKVSDLALLCATCHRLTHRAIALEKRWLSLEELKATLQPAEPVGAAT